MQEYRDWPARFKVAFSFAGAQRGAVQGVAEQVEAALCRGSVFYDDWFEPYLAGQDGDLKLENVYRQRADLVVVCISGEYNDRPWTQIEHRVIRTLAWGAPSDSPQALRALYLRFGPGEVAGIHVNTIAPNVQGRSAEDTAQLILQRLKIYEAMMQRATAASPPSIAVRPTREIEYLEALVWELRDRAPRYVAVAGQERKRLDRDRLLKSVGMEVTLLLRRFEEREHAAQPACETRYTDVLDAYRDLLDRPRRRLAVLGEPGAGKSFSLERVALEYAQRALGDPTAPLPLLVRLGLWTEPQPLAAFLAQQLGPLGGQLAALRDEQRAILLLDGMNEIPPSQRAAKAKELDAMAADERFASVIISCRERDFSADFRWSCDTLTLQALTPADIRAFLQRAFTVMLDTEQGPAAGERRFWQLAGGEDLREVWAAWEDAGANFESFWTASEIPRERPNVYSKTSAAQDERWHRMRQDRRGLIHLAVNPYLLTILAALTEIPRDRAQLFEAFLHVLHERERSARERRSDAHSVPDRELWMSVLAELAATLQHRAGDEDAQTALVRRDWPASLTTPLLAFAADASVLEVRGDTVRFTHQLLQESLAARVLTEEAAAQRPAVKYWPADRWWQRTGWEVVAELAAESCGPDVPALTQFIGWLAQANPEVACQAWRAAGEPVLAPDLHAQLSRWLPRMTDVAQEPNALARVALGRALGRFGLDTRRGVALRTDGVPDIDWVNIPEGAFIYGEERQRPVQLPGFRIARYPITHAQFQAFIDDGGYREAAWWRQLAQRFDTPASPRWDEPNAPRVEVSWYEAVAFCRWLTLRLGEPVNLPTEAQWERAARGTAGLEYPWGKGYRAGHANCGEDPEAHIGRTTAVGLYPQGRSVEGAVDLAGNVWEWCLNEHEKPRNTAVKGDADRVLRGGSWNQDSGSARAVYRGLNPPYVRNDYFGFRVCGVAPIEE